MKRTTNYSTAVNWLHNDFVLCNNIPTIDPTFWDNARFSLTDEDDNEIEIYQYYITNASQGDVEFLERSFGLLFAYSELLDCFILCVPHWGTSWDYVPCECLNDDISDSMLTKDLPKGF